MRMLATTIFCLFLGAFVGMAVRSYTTGLFQRDVHLLEFHQ